MYHLIRFYFNCSEFRLSCLYYSITAKALALRAKVKWKHYSQIYQALKFLFPPQMVLIVGLNTVLSSNKIEYLIDRSSVHNVQISP